MGKVSQKKNLSSIQVIKTLKLLMQGDYSMNELVELLNQNEEEPIFNNSVISKYINTCRFCGIQIPKVKNKYYVAKLPFGLELTPIDTDLLNNLKFVIENDFAKKWGLVFNKFAEKLNRYSNTDIQTVNKDNFKLSYELFERAVSQKRKIKLIFKNRLEQECIPISISHARGKNFFIVFNKRIRQIDINRLSGIQVTDNRYNEVFDGNQTVIYKLRGGLAKRYEARENEIIEQNSDGTITVTNRNENKEYLLSRLLRYDDKCEILQPKYFREEMKALLDDMLKNYGES